MNSDFATAMGRALEQTRIGNPGEATRLIQAALGGTRPLRREAQPRQRPLKFPKPAASIRRRSLGTVVDLLSKGISGSSLPNSVVGRPGTSPRPTVPSGAEYHERHHVTQFDRRDYRLFIPSERTEPVRGVILALHGCTQTADDFAVGTCLNEHGERNNLIVIYPEQPRTQNAMACWNWFQPGHQGHGAGEPAFLADLATLVATERGVGEGGIFAAGLSAGGAMAAILGQSYPEVFRAICVHSGLAPGAANDVSDAFAAMRGQARQGTVGAPVRTIVFHGTADQTVHRSNADLVLRAALGGEVTSEIETLVPASAGRAARCVLHQAKDGGVLAESWTIEGAGHAWSGGSPSGSFTDPTGPDASAEMVRFFLTAAEEDRS